MVEKKVGPLDASDRPRRTAEHGTCRTPEPYALTVRLSCTGDSGGSAERSGFEQVQHLAGVLAPEVVDGRGVEPRGDLGVEFGETHPLVVGEVEQVLDLLVARLATALAVAGLRGLCRGRSLVRRCLVGRHRLDRHGLCRCRSTVELGLDRVAHHLEGPGDALLDLRFGQPRRQLALHGSVVALAAVVGFSRHFLRVGCG